MSKAEKGKLLKVETLGEIKKRHLGDFHIEIEGHISDALKGSKIRPKREICMSDEDFKDYHTGPTTGMIEIVKNMRYELGASSENIVPITLIILNEINADELLSILGDDTKSLCKRMKIRVMRLGRDMPIIGMDEVINEMTKTSPLGCVVIDRTTRIQLDTIVSKVRRVSNAPVLACMQSVRG